MNLETIIDVLSWYRIRLLNGFNLIWAKPRLLKKQKRAYKSSLSRRGNQKSFTLTNSLEFGKACEDLSWKHCTSTPHRSEPNGIAERAVRRIEEGTSAALLQSSLDEKWQVDSMECYCYLRNIQDLLSDGKTPYEKRFGEPFQGPIIRFGSMVEYHPISATDLSRLHQFGTKKVLPRIFLGYVLYAWSGVANWRTKQPSNCTKLQIHALMTIGSKKKNWDLFDTCQK